MNVHENILSTVGNTPLVKLSRFMGESKATVLAKLESFNPMHSVKDRIGVSMVLAAEEADALRPGGTIVEPTSGNTGIGLAMVAAAKGYRLILTMPETMSIERRKILAGLGAEIVLTPGDKGMTGAVEKAEKLVTENKGWYMPMQFENLSNPEAHRVGTAEEIWRDTDGMVDVLVAGVGTGGTITGAGKALKGLKEDLKVIAVEPADSPVLSGGRPGPHKIQGIGPGFIPRVLDMNVLDEIVKVTSGEAFAAARELARKEGIFAGISSGAAVHAARMVASRLESAGKIIVVIVPDTGERYLSTELWTINGQGDRPAGR